MRLPNSKSKPPVFSPKTRFDDSWLWGLALPAHKFREPRESSMTNAVTWMIELMKNKLTLDPQNPFFMWLYSSWWKALVASKSGDHYIDYVADIVAWWPTLWLPRVTNSIIRHWDNKFSLSFHSLFFYLLLKSVSRQYYTTYGWI